MHFVRLATTLLKGEESARDNRVLAQWRQLDHVQTVCTSLQTDNHTSTSSLNFFHRPWMLFLTRLPPVQ